MRATIAYTSARILLFLLFLVIECLPVTVKLLQQPGKRRSRLPCHDPTPIPR